MAIVFISGTLELSGLNLQSEEEMWALKAKIEEAVRAVHPSLDYNSDVEYDIDEHAGDIKCMYCNEERDSKKHR